MRGVTTSDAGAAIAAGVFGVCSLLSPLAADGAELNAWHQPTPHFSLPTADGPERALSADGSRVVIIHFFATWCEPCRDELPALRRLAERAGPSLAVLAISVGETELGVRRFLAAMPLGFPVLLDRDRATAKAWGIRVLPTTVVLDAALAPRLAVEEELAWDLVTPEALARALAPEPADRTQD